MPKHVGFVLNMVFTPIKMKVGNPGRHDPNILMRVFPYFQNVVQRHFSSRPNQVEPPLELHGLTIEGLKHHLMLTKGHPVMSAISVQSPLNGENGEEQVLSKQESARSNTPIQNPSSRQKNLDLAEKGTTLSIQTHSFGRETKEA